MAFIVETLKAMEEGNQETRERFLMETLQNILERIWNVGPPN